VEAFTVEFYRKADGSCPVEEFLLSLDHKMRAKLLMSAALLEANGPFLREPYSKSLGDGIFEIRSCIHNRGMLDGRGIFSSCKAKNRRNT